MKNKFNLKNSLNKLKIRFRRFQPQREYDHILTLGYNCEVAYQFFHLYHFLESGLFSWTYSYRLQDTVDALEHLDRLGTDGFLATNHVWECRNTKICFHGKDLPGMSVAEAQQELTERIAYLKNKWARACAAKDQTVLFVIKIRMQPAEENARQIIQLYDTLKKMTAAPFDLLVIHGKLTTLPDFNNPHIFVRQVDHYAPDDDVPHKMAATKDWEQIFFEFGPKHYLPHTKHFLFEAR